MVSNVFMYIDATQEELYFINISFLLYRFTVAFVVEEHLLDHRSLHQLLRQSQVR